MVVGSGQIATIFNKVDLSNTIIFASGVSNSNCIDNTEFQREESLLLAHIKRFPEKQIIYFSSTALSARDYEKNAYYQHKEKMEQVICNYAKHYSIFRVPQLFGTLKQHNTLINYLYEKIVHEERFLVYSNAHRYVIYINDLFKIVLSFIKNRENLVVDVANPYRYSIYEIIRTIEILSKKKALYDIVEKEDQYSLDLSYLCEYIQKNKVDVEFGKEYLLTKLQMVI